MRRSIRISLGLTGIAACFALVATGGVVGAHYYLAPSLPEAQELREVRLQVPLRVYSRDGRLIAQMGEKRRIPVLFEAIPESLVQAFLAAEDDRFFDHPGVDYQGLIRAGLSLLATGQIRQGGSTITMQLARNYFLTNRQTAERKAREIFLALKIEREFSKQEILTLYLNKIFLGQRAYGVAAAAVVYFGKSLDELSLPEMATIAGLPKAPSRDNPVSSPERARVRRAYVLRRMFEIGSIDREVLEIAAAAPLESRLHGPTVELKAPYVAEMVRAEMLRMCAFELSLDCKDDVYSAGYRVTTTIDSALQESGVAALRRALVEYDRRHGYRGPLGNLPIDEPPPAEIIEVEQASPMDAVAAQVAQPLQQELSLETRMSEVLQDYAELSGLSVSAVVSVAEDAAQLYIKDHGYVSLDLRAVAWARPYIDDDTVGEAPESVAAILQPGDIVYAVQTVDGRWELGQAPDVQGSLVALDPLDGAISVLVGGYDYFFSKYNRANQAYRQPGSAFKPFIYSAAFENGFTAASVVNDAPVVLSSPVLEEVWRPDNSSGKVYGPTRVRQALVKSRNLVTIRVLREAGIGNTVEHLRKFGFGARALPRDPTLALGSGGVTALELGSAYTSFANGGFRTPAYFIQRIENADGEPLFEANPRIVCKECIEEPAQDDESDIVATNGGEPPRRTSPEDDAADEPLYETFEFEYAERIISPQNAFLIADMMQDVICCGTGRRARELRRDDLSGKTGTSNDRRDAWFSGFNGGLVATAWVGFDLERSLGRREEGARTALPVWKYFMADALASIDSKPPVRPDGLVEVKISPKSGLRVRGSNPDGIFEVFRQERIPELEDIEAQEELRYDDDRSEEEPEPDEPLF